MKTRHVERISCSTGWGSSGDWKFPNLKKKMIHKNLIKILTSDHYNYDKNPVGNV